MKFRIMRVNTASYAIFLSLFIRYSSQYVEFNVEDEDLCSLIKKQKIKLDKGPRSGLLVRQYRLSDHEIDWNKNFRCKFQVIPATSKEGVIAVIQHIIFRKNSTTDECIDYVQFTKKDGSSSQKFCGRFNAAVHMDHNFVDPEVPISTGNSFVDERGELDVIIYVAKNRLHSDEEIDLNIVFTAYKRCHELSRKDTSYKPCSLVHSEYCIYSGFFSDSYINCPLPDCRDELGCSKPEVVDGSKYDGNKVLIAALSTVSIMFLIFILCLWICKTYKIFCWSQSFANPSSTTPQDQAGTPRVIEMNEQTGPSDTQGNSSSANRLDEDKDLPPSYDSLFPTR